MLNEFQINRVWKGMIEAETRSLYFADLASRYTGQKQWITGASFFLSSGAAASIIGKAPGWVPLLLALAVAVTTAYSIAVNLDRKIATLAKLHSLWGRIKTDYDRLWNHTYDADAEEELARIIQREAEPSELATTDAPNNQKLLGVWENRVLSMYHVSPEQA